MEHPNAELYRRMIDAFQARDVDTFKGMIAPDVRWHEAGNPQVIEGRSSVADRMGRVGDVEGTLDLHDVLADDEHVVALLNVQLRKRDGSQVSYPVVEIAHVDGGQVTERWAFMDACPDDVTAFFAGLG